MNRTASFYHRRLALVDLDEGVAKTAPLALEIVEQGPGGGALAAALAERCPGAVVFSAGPLSGGYAPASGLLTLSFPRSGPRSEGGGLIHAVMPLGHGAWLRQSGFDALVVTGHSAAAKVIRCAGGACLLEDAPQTLPDRACLRAALLRRTEDGRAALLLADAANPALPVAGGAEYGSLPAGDIAGPVLQTRGILAVSLEGGCPLPSGQLPLDNALRRAVPASAPFPAAFFREAQRDAALAATCKLKSAACFHCPSPCLAWIETGKNAHLLLADHGAFAAALDACGAHAPACLAACDAAGVDPRTAAPFLTNMAAGEFPGILAALPRTGGSETPQRPAENLTETERLAAILGLCPRLVRRVSGLSGNAFEEALEETVEAVLGSGASAMLARSGQALGQEVFI